MYLLRESYITSKNRNRLYFEKKTSKFHERRRTSKSIPIRSYRINFPIKWNKNNSYLSVFWS